MKNFENIKKNFGFGCMRLPMKDDEVDYAEFNRMIDKFIEEGLEPVYVRKEIHEAPNTNEDEVKILDNNLNETGVVS